MAAITCPLEKAHACSTAAPDPTFDGVPSDGETNVPTNVVPQFFFIPFYQNDASGVPGTFVLETQGGEAVATTARLTQHQWFELVPAQLLQPNTGYRIRGTWRRTNQTFQTQLEFRTGAGPRTGPVAPPVAALQNLDWQPQTSVISSCGNSELQRTCVALQDEKAMVEYAHIDEFGQLSTTWIYLTRGSFHDTALTPALMQHTNFRCVRLRTRAIDGTFSEPVTLCGADAPVFHVVSDDEVACTSKGLEWASGARVQMDPPSSAADRDVPQPSRAGAGGEPNMLHDAGTNTAPIGGAPGALRIAPPRAGTAAPGATAAGETAVEEAAGSAAAMPSIAVPQSAAAARHVEACSVQPGHVRSDGGLLTLFGTLLATCALRVRRRRAARV